MTISKPRPGRIAIAGLCLFLMVAGGGAAAHDFWVQPASFWTAPGAVTAITLQVGHGPFRQRTPIAARRIILFTASGPNGVKDVRAALHLGGATDDGEIQLPAPGAYVLALETDATAESHLPAIRYNDYLKAEGLTPALELRARTHRTDADGSENYRRCAKALVQVGPATSRTAIEVTRPLGLTLEIVPETNPYAVSRPARLPVRVIYEGRLLAGAFVKLNNLDHDDAPVETRRTDASGRAVFTMPPAGRWQMNVIWTKPLPRTRETDFETTFSSFSFGRPG